MRNTESPTIESAEWGRIEVAGFDDPFCDVKLWPGGARPWDWTETDTHHVPGIQPADVEELVAAGAEIVILSKGFHKRLQVQDQTISWLRRRGIEAEVLETSQAVERYNELADERAVGGLFHSTC